MRSDDDDTRRARPTVFLVLALLWAFAVPWSVAVAEAALWLAALAWSIGWIRDELDRPHDDGDAAAPGPAGDAFALIGAPILAFWGVSILSALTSRDRIASLWELREMFLFVAPLVAYAAARRVRHRRWMVHAFTAGVLASVTVGIGETLLASSQGSFPGTLPQSFRPDGPLGHYMTYAGMLMVAIPLLLGERDGAAAIVRRLLAAAAVGVIGLTMTRSAWLGCGVALLVWFVAGRIAPRSSAPDAPPRPVAGWGVPLFVFAAVVVLLVLSLAGGDVLLARGASIFSIDNPTNKDRLAMAATGLRLIARYPWLGIGPGMVETVYPAWVVSWAVRDTNPHLHNNPLQIAVERGLLGLAAWLWMMAAFVVGPWRVLRARGPDAEGGAKARAALAALAGFLTMGMFEYNFSDSEVLMALLFVLTLPFAADAGPASDRSSEGGL